MTQIIIEDPDLYEEKPVDSSGRIYLGTDWAGKKVKVAIEVVQESEEDGDCAGNQSPAAAKASN